MRKHIVQSLVIVHYHGEFDKGLVQSVGVHRQLSVKKMGFIAQYLTMHRFLSVSLDTWLLTPGHVALAFF
jgi:hypothetical protein